MALSIKGPVFSSSPAIRTFPGVLKTCPATPKQVTWDLQSQSRVFANREVDPVLPDSTTIFSLWGGGSLGAGKGKVSLSVYPHPRLTAAHRLRSHTDSSSPGQACQISSLKVAHMIKYCEELSFQELPVY